MSDPKPKIYQISLRDLPQQFIRTLDKIRKFANIQAAFDTQEALDLLGQDKVPKAILITDDAIMEPENEEVSKRVVEYARNGGTVILGLAFAYYAMFEEFDHYMSEHWGLPWRGSNFGSENFAINISATGPPGKEWLKGLQAFYHQESSYLGGVDDNACWYLPAPYPYCPEEDGTEEEWRAKAEWVSWSPETPVAFAPYGKGYLGYTGDENQLESTDAIVLSMLGFNDPPE